MATTTQLPDSLKNNANFLAIEKEIQSRRNDKYNQYPKPFPTFEGRFVNTQTITANLKLIADNEAKISNYNEKLIPAAKNDYAVKNGDYNAAMKSGTGVCQATFVGKVLTYGINQKNEKCQQDKRNTSNLATATLNGYVASRDSLIATNKRLDADNQGYIAQNLGIINTILAEADQWVKDAQKWVDEEEAKTKVAAQSTVTNQQLLTNGLNEALATKVKLYNQAADMGATITADGNVVKDQSKMQNNIFIGIAVALAIGLAIYLFKGNN